MLVGHDFGSRLAGYCVVVHPGLFASVVFMSAPFGGVGNLLPASSDGVDDRAKERSVAPSASGIATALTALQPPRKHYTEYFATPSANADILGQGGKALQEFLDGYFYMKSGAWDENDAHPLPSAFSPSPSIGELAKDFAALPEYYIMPLHESMSAVIARHIRITPKDSDEEVAARIYAAEFARTGFQGGLNYYRSRLSPPPPEHIAQLDALAGRRVDVPAAFIAGARDWGVYHARGGV
jgi:pimeloyl-ACP methyl ester carboxylesterase